jgi:hypothetical protein
MIKRILSHVGIAVLAAYVTGCSLNTEQEEIVEESLEYIDYEKNAVKGLVEHLDKDKLFDKEGMSVDDPNKVTKDIDTIVEGVHQSFQDGDIRVYSTSEIPNHADNGGFYENGTTWVNENNFTVDNLVWILPHEEGHRYMLHSDDMNSIVDEDYLTSEEHVEITLEERDFPYLMSILFSDVHNFNIKTNELLNDFVDNYEPSDRDECVPSIYTTNTAEDWVTMYDFFRRTRLIGLSDSGIAESVEYIVDDLALRYNQMIIENDLDSCPNEGMI